MPEIYDALENNDAEVRRRAEYVAQALEARAAKQLNLKYRVDDGVSYGVRTAAFTGMKLTVEDARQLVCLYRLEHLLIQDTVITDDVLQHVGQMRRLDSLQLYSRDARGNIGDSIRITDEGLQHLASLGRLRSFSVVGTRIRGKGFAALAQIPSLLSISINRCRAIDESLAEGLEAFKNHKAISYLSITFCRVPQDVPEAISRISSLQRLYLSGTTITDDGLKPLSALPNLQHLDVDFTRVSDSGVRYLTKCPQLQILYVKNTEISDTGVRYLATCPRLQRLELSWTKVTPDGLIALRDSATLRGVVADGILASATEQEAIQRSLPGLAVGWDPERATPPKLRK